MNHRDYEWSDALELNHPEIDSQHRYLFDLADQIRGADPDEAKKILMKLYNYTRVHFSKEEKHMRATSYPHYHEHQELHLKLIEQLNLTCQSGLEDQNSIHALIDMVMAWVKQHILGEDMKYAQFLREQQSKADHTDRTTSSG